MQLPARALNSLHPTPLAFRFATASAPLPRGSVKTKARPKRPGLAGTGAWRRDESLRLLRRRLGEITFERLVGFLGEVGVELAELAAARDEAFVGALEEGGLDLDRLLQRLGAEQLFGCRGSGLESLLR